MNQPIDWLINKWVNQSVGQLTNQTVSHPIKQAANQLINQLLKVSTNLWVSQTTQQSVKHQSINQSVFQTRVITAQGTVLYYALGYFGHVATTSCSQDGLRDEAAPEFTEWCHTAEKELQGSGLCLPKKCAGKSRYTEFTQGNKMSWQFFVTNHH